MKILVADEDPVSRHLITHWLAEWGYDPVAAENGAEALTLLQAPDAPRLAVLDWMMPGLSGLDVCQRLRLGTEQRYVYVLLLSARDRREDLVQGLQTGADDYLIKPVHPAELKARLCVGARILAWQEQLVEARESLRYQVTHDALTGLLSRNAFLEVLEKEWQRLRREGGSLGLILADLDHFKQINDALGHAAGDQALQLAAGRMRGLLRPYDSLCRYGGEEFLALLPGCDLEQAANLAERLLTGLREAPLVLADCSVRLTASLGATACPAREDFKAEDLIRVADLAMYRAKRAGRDRVVAIGRNGPFRIKTGSGVRLWSPGPQGEKAPPKAPLGWEGQVCGS